MPVVRTVICANTALEIGWSCWLIRVNKKRREDLNCIESTIMRLLTDFLMSDRSCVYGCVWYYNRPTVIFVSISISIYLYFTPFRAYTILICVDKRKQKWWLPVFISMRYTWILFNEYTMKYHRTATTQPKLQRFFQQNEIHWFVTLQCI